jgi:hypothetical protein
MLIQTLGIVMKKLLLTIFGALSLFLISGHANAGYMLDFYDEHYLGSISDPTPASSAADKERVTRLVDLGFTGSPVSLPGIIADPADYLRSGNHLTLESPVGDDCSQGGNGNVFKAAGCDYIIQKYGGSGAEPKGPDNGNAYVWYIGDLIFGDDDILTTPDWDTDVVCKSDPVGKTCKNGKGDHANQWQAFGGTSIPEPSILALFGLGLLGLGFARRRKA